MSNHTLRRYLSLQVHINPFPCSAYTILIFTSCLFPLSTIAHADQIPGSNASLSLSLSLSRAFTFAIQPTPSGPTSYCLLSKIFHNPSNPHGLLYPGLSLLLQPALLIAMINYTLLHCLLAVSLQHEAP